MNWFKAAAFAALCAIPALANSPAVCAASEPNQFSERFLEEKLACWQKRLKLESWHISIVLSRRDDLKPKTLGGIRWDKGKGTATIVVMDPTDYKTSVEEMLADMEFTLVHELVHLELASLPRSGASRTQEEFAVNRLADALLGR